MILIIGGFLGLLAGTVAYQTYKENEKTPSGIIVLIIIGGMLFGAGWAVDINYRQGQIDALTGLIKYKLVENPDKTKTWQEIK